MTAYELVNAIKSWGINDYEEEIINTLRQQADKLKKYELRNTEQRKRIEELEKELKCSNTACDFLKKEYLY